MNTTKDLLEQLCQDADMGQSSVKQVMAFTDDPQLHATLDKHLRDYQRAYDKAGALLEHEGNEPKHSSPMTKLMAHVGAEMQTFTDRSPSKIADMVIQGSTMGVTTITKQLHQYDGSDPAVKDLAEKHVEMQQNHIEDLKSFL